MRVTKESIQRVVGKWAHPDDVVKIAGEIVALFPATPDMLEDAIGMSEFGRPVDCMENALGSAERCSSPCRSPALLLFCSFCRHRERSPSIESRTDIRCRCTARPSRLPPRWTGRCSSLSYPPQPARLSKQTRTIDDMPSRRSPCPHVRVWRA